MSRNDYTNDNSRDLGSIIHSFKIGFCICLLLLGIYVVHWTVGTIDKLLNHSDNVTLVQTFLHYESQQSILDISINQDNIIIKNNDTLKFISLLLIFIVLFNIIGKAITVIFTSMVKIVQGLDIKGAEKGNTPSK